MKRRGPGRPKHTSKLVTCAFEITTAQKRELVRIAKARGESRSATIRHMLEKYVHLQDLEVATIAQLAVEKTPHVAVLPGPESVTDAKRTRAETKIGI